MITRRSFLTMLILALAVLLSACSAQPTTLPATASATYPVIPAEPTRTLTPVPTETAPSMPTQAIAQESTPTPALSATPDPALAQVKLLGLTWMKGYNMLLSFQFPGPVEIGRYVVRVEEKDYPCQKLASHPDRLYCIGPGVKVLAQAIARIYPAGSDQPGFETKFWVPYFDNDYGNTFGDSIDEKMSDPYHLP